MHLKEAGYTLKEEAQIYDDTLQDIKIHTRWYLDNLERLKSYRVRWHDYGERTPTIPYRFTWVAKKAQITK